MENFTTQTIREIAVATPSAVPVFEEYGIDYCCGGGRNFDDACQSAGVAPAVVSAKLNHVLHHAAPTFAPTSSQSASELIDYIVEKHHTFTRQEITRLTALMEKVCRKHGAAHPELAALQESFAALCDDLTPHLRKEEMVLFPFIKHLEASAASHQPSLRPPFRTVKNPVRMMLTEHDTAGDILRQMRDITTGYAVPENVCASFRALYHGLAELEKDLHRHIHLENNILFEQAVRLEQQVLFGY